MKNMHRRFDTIAAAAMLLTPLLITVYLLFLNPNDISASQTGKQRVFGATYMTMNNPYFQVLDTQIQAHLELRGDVLLTRDAAMDQERQNQEIQELVDAGVCAIFMTPVEWDTSKDGVRIAAAAGVPVIVVDAPIQDPGLAACSVLSDNYQAGVLCARHLLSVRSSAKILLLEHITARSGADRIQGFKDTIAGHDGFEILGSGESDGQIENAMPVMEGLLREYPDADVLMALNDPSAFGGLAAIQGAGLSERFLVYSVDGSPEGKAMVSSGFLTATCAQFPSRVAEEAVKQAYAALEGGCERGEVIVPVELLTEENVDRYGIDGWQ
ncbi:MAG: sugar ABC transporter substrate-binding protein [Oscillospiraceae bacterium]|nr:sugar ABC transporter substrate-binding protein [Oscillospiraceae bacterium]